MIPTCGKGGLIRFLALVLLLAFNHVAWAASDEQSPGPDKIVAVILEDAPPTLYRNKITGEAAGFAVDITNEVARRAGFSVSYKFTDNWDTIREIVQRGDGDIGPGLSISPEREGYYSFSEPFDNFTISFFARAGTGMTELKPGASVGANKGSVAYELLHQRPGFQMIPYVNFQTGLFDVLTGKIDAFAGPTPVLWRLAQDAHVEDQLTVVEKPLTEVKRAFGVKKGRIELVTRLNKALYGFVGSPEYQKLYSKWYAKPTPYLALTKQTIWTLIVISLVIIILVFWRYLSVTGLTRQLRREIEERKKIEENVLLSEERLRLALASSQQGWFDLDIPTGAIKVSPEYASMIGYDPAEFSTSLQGWIDGMHPEDRDAVLKEFHECLEKKDMCTMEYRRHTKTGEWLWISTVGKVVGFDPEQRPLRMTGTHKDITERKRTEEELKKVYDELEIRIAERTFELKTLNEQLMKEVAERKQAEEALLLSRNQMEAVAKIGAMVNSTLDIGEVLSHILTGTLKAAGASVGMIFLREQETGCLKWGASHGLSEAFVEAFRAQVIMPGEGLTGLIAQTGETIFIPEDSSHDPRIARPVIKAEGLNSFIGVPVYAEDKIVAVMNILTRPPDVLREKEIALIKAVSTHVGFAIRNAQLFKERKQAEEALRRSHDELELRVEGNGRRSSPKSTRRCITRSPSASRQRSSSCARSKKKRYC